MATAPPTVTPLPDPPSTSDPTNFDARADAFLDALPDFQTEMDALAENVFDNAELAETAASDAETAEAGALAAQAGASLAANATMWASGTYATGVCTWSPISFHTYRRTSTSPGASAVDPSAAPSLWEDLTPTDLVTQRISGSQTLAAGFAYTIYGNGTYTLPAITGSNDRIGITVLAGVTAAIIAPAGSDKIRTVAGNMNVDVQSFSAIIRDTGATDGWV